MGRLIITGVTLVRGQSVPNTQEKERQGWGLVVWGQWNKAGTGWDCNWLAAVGCSEKEVKEVKEERFSVWSQPEAQQFSVASLHLTACFGVSFGPSVPSTMFPLWPGHLVYSVNSGYEDTTNKIDRIQASVDLSG